MQKTCQRSQQWCERVDHDFAQVVAKCKRAHDRNSFEGALRTSKRTAAAVNETSALFEYRDGARMRAAQRHWRPD